MANIDWLSYRKNFKGRDPLGVQAIGIHVYGLLIPGITNVTDRLRYYSFFPWIVKLYVDENIDMELSQFIRRCEFLFGLSTNYKHKDEQGWSGRMVGTIAISKGLKEIEEKGELQLTKYTTHDPTEFRYFKRKFGGLDQYYIGPLKSMDILYKSGSNNYHLTKPRGIELADNFKAGAAKTTFLNCIKSGKVTTADLNLFKDDLIAERLFPEEKEYQKLAEFLLDADDITRQEQTFNRRNTLALLYTLIEQHGESCDYWGLLNILYYGIDHNNQRIEISPKLQPIVGLWKFYLLQEYFSVSLTALFVGIQHALATPLNKQQLFNFCWDEYIKRFDSQQLPGYFKEFQKLLAADCKVEEVISWIKSHYNPDEAWKDGAISEYNLGQLIIGEQYPADKLFCVGLLLLLIVLFKVSLNEVLPEGFDLNRTFSDYPVNLTRFNNDYKKHWYDRDIKIFLFDVLNEYIINRHLQVGFKKLYSEGIATFRFFQDEGKLKHSGMEIDSVEITHPRLTNSMQMLADLGILKQSGQKFALSDGNPGVEFFAGVLGDD